MRGWTPNRTLWTVLLIGLAGLVVLGHVALWTSEETTAFKWRLTVLNALGWTVALGPILLVNLWLRSVERANAARGDGPPPAEGDGPT